MSAIRVANAPCSWGVLEFDPEQIGGDMPDHAQVLNEIAQTGYEGTELGDWGFMPTDPAELRTELASRRLDMVGAFVPVKLADLSAHQGGLEKAVRTALLMAEAVGTHPFIVLSDDNGTDPTRTSLAGRIRPEHGLTGDQWLIFAEGAQRIARAVREQAGLRTVLHHHCAGFVETPDEVETFLRLTQPELIGLCFDTGHYVYGGGDALDGIRRHADRTWHVHFKACSPEVIARARTLEWDYFEATRGGLFCELGQGNIDFQAILDELNRHSYRGWIVVEQDVLPGTGTPLKSARRNREHLRDIWAKTI